MTTRNMIMAFQGCITGAALLAAASLSAGQPINSRIDRSGPGLTGKHDPKRNSSARAGVNAYLRCSAALNRGGALEVLGKPFRSAEQVALANDFLPSITYADDRTSNCFGNFGSVEIGVDPVTLVGALAEFFVIDRYHKTAAADIAALSKEDWKSDELTPRNASEALAMCVTEERPDLVLRLVEAVPESAAERQAIKGIVPLLSPCLPMGLEASFDARSLRAILAFGLFRTTSQIAALRRSS